MRSDFLTRKTVAVCVLASIAYGSPLPQSGAEDGPVLGRDGKATCSIFLAPGALEFEQLAARELADHLEKVIGDRPMVTDRPNRDASTTIYVGRSAAIDRKVADVDFKALGTDGIVIRTMGDDLVLTGGRPRGVLFAVYTFLQDGVGVRWWAPHTTTIPTKPSLALPSVNIVYRPPFDLRRFSSGALNDNRTFPLRLRHNGHVIGYDLADHTILKLVPPKKFFAEHPDWYMYTPENDTTTGEYSYEAILSRVRQSGPEKWYDLAVKTRRLPAQICTSSAGALEEATQAVLRQLEEQYPTWEYPPKVVLVTQNNGVSECQCDACLATKRREGAASATWVEFVNAIAERVEEDYSDVLIAMMAFVNTEKPPATVRPRHNVLVYSIPVTSNRKLPVSTVREGEWVAKWCDIAEHVYVWEHEPNFRYPLEPHPNHFAMAQNLRFFADHGVKGLMIEGKGGNVAEFQRMRAYVWCQMMWDPRQDPRRLMTDFLGAYYGDAAPFLKQWIDAQHSAGHRAKDFVLSAYSPTTK